MPKDLTIFRCFTTFSVVWVGISPIWGRFLCFLTTTLTQKQWSMSDGYSSTFVPKPQWRVSPHHSSSTKFLAPRVHKEPWCTIRKTYFTRKGEVNFCGFVRSNTKIRLRVSRKTFFHAKSRDRLVKSVVSILRFLKLIICFLYFSQVLFTCQISTLARWGTGQFTGISLWSLI